MHTRAQYDEARRLAAAGLRDAEAARLLGLPRETVRDWRRSDTRCFGDPRCSRCGGAPLAREDYAYLLGLYLGDGYLVALRRGVYHLRITLDARYATIVDEAARAVSVVSGGRRVGRQARRGCVVVSAYWKHWRCLFPQHGVGRKHVRSIQLEPWQQMVLRQEPGLLLRGLIHSDGSRVQNRVGGKAYARYFFSNRSADILGVFSAACNAYGVHWTRSSWKEVSVARRADVARLDLAVGPKR